MKNLISYLFVFIFIISASLFTACTSEEPNKEEVKQDALQDLQKELEGIHFEDSTKINIQ